MREHSKDTIKCQVLINQEEEISPVPSKVFYDSIGIAFSPNGEEAQQNTHSIQRKRQQSPFLGSFPKLDAKDNIAGKVIVQNDINQHSPAQPSVERSRIVLLYLKKINNSSSYHKSDGLITYIGIVGSFGKSADSNPPKRDFHWAARVKDFGVDIAEGVTV